MPGNPLAPFRIAVLTENGFGRDLFSLRREMNSLVGDVAPRKPTFMPQINVSEPETAT